MKFTKLKLFIFLLMLLSFLTFIFYLQTNKTRPTEKIMNEIGELKIGDYAPFRPGEEIQNAYHKISPSKFYVYLWSPNIKYECAFEECGKNGEIVASLRGWLSGTGTSYEELVPLVNSSKVKSLIIVADKNSKIVGVYPNKDMPDVLNILANHKDLADFEMLKGITELGDLKLNSLLPFDPINFISEQFKEEIPKPNFYLIAIHETTSNENYCPYYECGSFLETIFDLGGWFLDFNHNNPEIIRKLGLDPSQVARGEITLIMVADKNKKIVSIHPNNDMRDIYTVLTQHPNLIHFEDFPWH